MRYRNVEGFNFAASNVIMGSTIFGTGEALDITFEILDAYIAIGGNWIDTARVYGRPQGDTEKGIGIWLRERGCRDKVILGTKGGHPPFSDMHMGRLDRANLEGDLEESLDALGTDHVEVYYLHRDDIARPVGDILETLNGFVESGKVKLLGASNWTTARMAEANAYAAAHGLCGFTANQPMWSLAKCIHEPDETLLQMDSEMYAFHAQSNMLATPYSSQAKGYFMKLESGALSEKAATRYDGPENRALFDLLCALSKQTGHSVGALQLAWLICQPPFPVFPIVGASSVGQVRALTEAADVVLSDEQVRELKTL